MDEHDTPYLWLRYSTQFTSGGRSHTIEMQIPVPVGASAEQREQLIREAEAGIEQLYRQIERRGSQRNQQSPETGRPQEAAQRSKIDYASSRQLTPPAPPVVPTRQPVQSSPPQQVAAQAATRDASKIISLQEKTEVADAHIAGHPSIGSEMPSTHNLSTSASGNIKLAQFIQIIKNNWGLTPKQAMDLLQVKTLNNMNYRDLIRQLESLVPQNQSAESAPKNTTGQPRPAPAQVPPTPPTPRASAPTSSTTMRDAGARPASSSPSGPVPAPPPSATNRAPAPPTPPAPAPPSPRPPAPSASAALDGPANIPVFPLRDNALREVPRFYKFDEEDEEPEEAASGNDEDENGMSDTMARIKVDDLKEIRGTAAASQGRLTVLHTLLDSQISDTQFQQLIEGLWNINSDKKLKQDHVEALISWAKEDYFEDEVRAVLAVLNG
jgi:hypothetical protein